MKTILKKVLPSTWTGWLANNLNKVNRKTFGPLFFKEYPAEKIKHITQNKLHPVELVFGNFDAAHQNLSPAIKNAFQEFNSHRQTEFLASVQNCFIEPKYGWPLASSRELIYDCFPFGRQEIMPLPSPFALMNKNVRDFDKIISFRVILEFGYWHFFTDILHKNYLLHNIGKDVPILVSKQLSDRPQFKFFYDETDMFDGRQLIIQDDFMVRACEAFFVKPMPHNPSYYKMTSEKCRAWKGNGELNRRVFLVRHQSRGRYIENMDEVAKVISRYSFELVDADTLSIKEQIKLFSETGFLIGIHGAGLTNMMFRYPNKMKVVELFPKASGRFQIPPHYFLLAGIFDFP